MHFLFLCNGLDSHGMLFVRLRALTLELEQREPLCLHGFIKIDEDILQLCVCGDSRNLYLKLYLRVTLLKLLCIRQLFVTTEIILHCHSKVCIQQE